MERIRIGQAAKHLGVHPDSIRSWTKQGEIPCVWAGGQRRYLIEDLDEYAGIKPIEKPRVEAHYIRVSGSSGQETSLETQERELLETQTSETNRIFKDRASGLRETRPGLNRMILAAKRGRDNPCSCNAWGSFSEIWNKNTNRTI